MKRIVTFIKPPHVKCRAIVQEHQCPKKALKYLADHHDFFYPPNHEKRGK